MDFLEARDGDHLMVPFECDVCIFRKLKGRDPIIDNPQDSLLQECIRRANLDACWGRARTTVNQNKNKVNMALRYSEELGLEGTFEHQGPYPFADHCGYELACNMLLYSRRKGRYDKSYTQFSTIRSLRSAFTNHCNISPGMNMQHLSMKDHRGRHLRLVMDKSGSLWFQRFIIGCQKRMGVVWKPNNALSTRLLLKLLEDVEQQIQESADEKSINLWVVFSAYATVSYTISLRGNEGLLLDLDGLISNWEKGDDTFFIVALLGKIKGELVDRQHLIPCTHVTSTGINVREIVKRLIRLKKSQGFNDGPAISDEKGKSLSSSELDDLMIQSLEGIYDKEPNLFPPNVRSKEDIRERYHCFRTWRKTSATRAGEVRVNSNDVNTVNRWDEVGGTKGQPSGQPMRQYYIQLELLKGPFLRYTRAM